MRSSDRVPRIPGILFLYRYNDPSIYGGIERKILTIARWLKEKALFEPVLLTNFEDSAFARDFRQAGFPVHTLDMDGPLGFFRTAAEAKVLIHRYGATLLQTHRFRESLTGAMVRRDIPELIHIHRVHTHINHSEIAPWKISLYHRLDRIAQPWIDRYIVLSEAIRDELVLDSKVASHKIRIVHNGIPPLDTDGGIQDDDHPLPARVAVVGTVEQRKRQEYLIRAVAALRAQDNLDVELRVIGGFQEEYGNWIRRLAEELGVADLVDFRGYCPDVASALGSIPVVAIASDFEGIPTSIIEGMSAGRLGLATRVGGTAELIQDGVNGLLLEPGNWELFRDALRVVFTTPSAKWAPLRRAGRQTFQKHFTTEAMMHQLADNYRELGLIRNLEA